MRVEKLELFFENLLLGADHDLKNRYLHVDYKDYNKQESNLNISKCQNGTLDGTLNDTLGIILEELAVMNAIRVNAHLTQKQLEEQTGLSERTIKRKTVILQENGLIKRVNGKRNGQWEIIQ